MKVLFFLFWTESMFVCVCVCYTKKGTQAYFPESKVCLLCFRWSILFDVIFFYYFTYWLLLAVFCYLLLSLKKTMPLPYTQRFLLFINCDPKKKTEYLIAAGRYACEFLDICMRGGMSINLKDEQVIFLFLRPQFKKKKNNANI